MSSVQDPSSITNALAQALEAAREGQRAQEAAAGQVVEAEGAEGKVRVTATLAGKVKVEIVDPRAVRLGVEVLAEEITTAVNAALDAAREQAGVPGDIDLSELSGKLEEIQQQSTQRLQSFISGLTDAHDQIVRSAGDAKGGR